jgi:PAS domain S-box-containing protein
MSNDSFIQRVEAIRHRLETAQEQTGQSPVSFQTLLADLATAIELLQTAAEKLCSQNEALTAARQATQVECQRYQELLQERRRVEEALRMEHHLLELERKHLRSVLDIIPAALWVVDAQGQILTQSAMSKTIWAGDPLPDDHLGEYKGWWAITDQPLAPEDWSRIRALTKGETSINEEINIEAFDGTRKTILSSAVPIRDEQESIAGAVVLNMDITERKQAEEALRLSDARNRALLNAIPDMMFRISRAGVYLDYKPAKAPDLSVPATEFLGKKIADVLPAELAQQMMQQIERALQSGETQICEYQLPINGKIRQREARIIASGENEVLVIVRDITERKAREALLKEERARIARELHDSLAQNLYFLGLKLDYIRKQVTTAPANVIIGELSTLKKTVQANIDDVRRTIFSLRPVELEALGFGPALKKYIREFEEQVGLEVSLKVKGEAAALPPTIEPVLFRLVQEGLTNIAKHAQARSAWLELAIQPGRTVCLTIKDDGVGFDPHVQPTMNSHKIGLRQMGERVTELEGQFKVESAPGQGVRLRLEIPLPGSMP